MGREILRRFGALPEERLALFRAASEIAASSRCGLYWVGGGVRDLWLGTSELDIDLVVEGELTPFAERLACRLGSELHSHSQFMTAELRLPGGLRIDLVRARSETYPSPASLPVVAPGDAERDLARRDFTINCMAIPLSPGFGDRLIDPCDGRRDLASGLLRTLHPNSFRDDPTRILRGLEFAARFGFELAAETREEARRAIASGVVARLSPARLGDAMRRALSRSASASRVLRQMRELTFLEAIEGGLVRSAGAAERFDAAVAEAVGGRREDTFRLAMLCLALDLDAGERALLAGRLALPLVDRELVTAGPDRVRAALSGLEETLSPSAVHARLGPLRNEELAVVAAQSAAARAWVGREAAELRAVRLAIGGRDLIAAGVAPGPELGRALELTLEAKLDGRIGDESELAYALRAAGRAGHGGSR